MRRILVGLVALAGLSGSAFAQAGHAALAPNKSHVGQHTNALTRGPGAIPTEPQAAVSAGQPSSPSAGGHVPTDQELKKGAAPSLVDLGPIPRPQLGDKPAGM